MKKIVFVICDGLGDRPIKEFNGLTPLEKADTPNLDRFAREGATGLVQVADKDSYPDSDIAHLSLFGYDLKKYYCGRGPIEATGIGMKLEKGDIAWRCNLATVDENLIIKDRRAGRIESTAEFVKDLDGMEIEGVKFLIKPGTAHRAILVLRGRGISEKVKKNDPKVAGEIVMVFEAKDESKDAKFTARIMNEFLARSYKILTKNPLNKHRINEGKLPANYLLCRSAGKAIRIPSFKEKYGLEACCIAGAGLYKGIGRHLGMDLIDVEGANGLPSTNVEAKFKAAIDALQKYDFVFVHVKGADSLGEDGNFEGKKQFIEKIDKAAKVFENLKDAMLVITADHSTPCELKKHSSDPVPLLIWGSSIKADSVNKFGERTCAKGSIGKIESGKLMSVVLGSVDSQVGR